MKQRLQRITQRITDAATTCGRDPASVRLVAVSKTIDTERVSQAIDAGATDVFARRFDWDGTALGLEIPVDVLNRKIEESEVVRPEGYRPRYAPGGSRQGTIGRSQKSSSQRPASSASSRNSAAVAEGKPKKSR